MRVLILHPDDAERIRLTALASEAGYVSLPVASLEGAPAGEPAILLLGLPAASEPAAEALRLWRRDAGGRPSAVIAIAPPGDASAALGAGADDVMSPGANAESLAARLAVAARHVDALARQQEDTRRLQAIIETSPDAILIIGMDLQFHFVSPSFRTAMGFDDYALRGPQAFDLIHSEDRPGVIAHLHHVLTRAAPGDLVETTFRIRHADGGWRYVEAHSRPMIDASGGRDGALVILRNVTARQETLLDAQAAFQHFFANNPDPAWIFDVETLRILDVNEVAIQRYGYSREEFLDLTIVELRPAEDRERLLHYLAADPPATQRGEWRHMTRGGEVFWVEVRSHAINFGGLPARLVAVSDISERKHAEDALRANEEMLRRVFDTAVVGITITDEAGTMVSLNDAACEMLGYRSDELVGRHFTVLIPESEREAMTGRHRQLFSSPRPATASSERVLYRRDGKALVVARSTSIFTGPDGNRFAVTTNVDVTARRRAEEALRQSEEYLRTVLANAPIVIIATDAEGKIQLAEGVFVSEVEEMHVDYLGRSVFDFFPPASRGAARLRRALDGEEETLSIEFAGRSFDVRVHPWRTPVGAVGGLICVANDVTERKRGEQALLQAQKLESLGVLAGGVAHDFNNLLVGILGNAGLALAELPPDSELRPTIQAIEIAGQRAAELSRQMLAYSGKGRFVVQQCDLNTVAAEMAQLLRTSIAKGAVLDQRFTQGLPAIEADLTQIRQVIMNLVINASDAFVNGEGTITISTGLSHATPADMAGAYVAPDLIESDYVFLEVTDSGSGMDAETLRRIFDPFFTTKFTGRGLGLAAVLGIVRGHRGAIKVWSEPGRGSRFTLYLPCVAGAVLAGAPAPTAESQPKAQGTVLVADDEEMVRLVTVRSLEMMGFTVLQAADGIEAVETLREHAGEIVCTLLDMTMPRMSGEETLRAIRQAAPSLPIVVMSGYSEQETMGRLGETEVAGFVQKPFTLADLQEAVAAAVAGGELITIA